MKPLIPLTIIISGVVVVQAGHLPRLPQREFSRTKVEFKSTQTTNEIKAKEGAIKHQAVPSGNNSISNDTDEGTWTPSYRKISDNTEKE